MTDTARSIAAAVVAGSTTASAQTEAALARIARDDGVLGAFTDVVAVRARAAAAVVDAKRARGEPIGPLAGVPFAVKNLFDIAGLPTRAGSKINRDAAPANADAFLVRRLEAAGAILVGGLNMGEYAYDFTGENAHDGDSHNPHDPSHMAGGSSGGSGAAVGGGLVPLALGSDTNGSIRVPASFCGIFGLKPTYGRLSRGGSFPFVASLDHLGPFARDVGDLATCYDILQGDDPADPAQARRAAEPVRGTLEGGADNLQIATLGGYFADLAEPVALAAVGRVADHLGSREVAELPGAARARAAAYLITMAEGAALHLSRLRERAADFDPEVRDRLVAGALLPAAWVIAAQKFRATFRGAAAALFERVDVLLAPATPCQAPRLGQKTMVLGGREMLVRANIGIYTQPLSFIGLPVVTVPVWTKGDRLPIGVQIIAPPWREDLALRVARALERDGVVAAPLPASGLR